MVDFSLCNLTRNAITTSTIQAAGNCYCKCHCSCHCSCYCNCSCVCNNECELASNNYAEYDASWLDTYAVVNDVTRDIQDDNMDNDVRTMGRDH